MNHYLVTYIESDGHNESSIDVLVAAHGVNDARTMADTYSRGATFNLLSEFRSSELLPSPQRTGVILCGRNLRIIYEAEALPKAKPEFISLDVGGVVTV